MNQKGLAPLLIVLLIAAAIGGYFIYKNQANVAHVDQQILQTAPNPTISDDTTNWKTYTNTNYGLSVKYPSDLKIQDITNNNRVRFFNDKNTAEEYINIIISTYTVDPAINLKERIEKDTIKGLPNGTQGSIIKGTIENYNSGNLTGFTYHGGGEVDFKHVLFKEGNKIYEFVLQCFETGCSYKDNKNAEIIFGKIISTFKFFEPIQVAGTMDWQTYIDFYQLYLIKYPPSWVNSGGRGVGCGGAVISAVKDPKSSGSSWLAVCPGTIPEGSIGGGVGGQASLLSKEEVNIGGYKSTKQVVKVEGSLDNKGKDIYVTEYLIDPKAGVAIYLYSYEGISLSKYQEEFDKILSTLRIIK